MLNKQTAKRASVYRNTPYTRSHPIYLKAAHPNSLQITHQGIQFAKRSELLAALGGKSSFDQAVAHKHRLANSDHDTDGTGS